MKRPKQKEGKKIFLAKSKRISRILNSKQRKKPEKKGPNTNCNNLLEYLEEKRTKAHKLPLSGPNILENNPCSFFLAGYCKFGVNCRRSHMIMEKINDIEVENNDELPKLANFKEVKSSKIDLISKIDLMRMFSLYSYDKTKITHFYALSINSKVLKIYSENKIWCIKSLHLPLNEHIANFECLNSDSTKQRCRFDSYLLILTNNLKLRLIQLSNFKLIKVFDLKKSNLNPYGSRVFLVNNFKYTPKIIVKKNQKSSKVPEKISCETFMIVDGSGLITYFNTRNSSIIQINHIGMSINEFLNCDLDQNIVYPSEKKVFKTNPQNFVIAGKSLVVWDNKLMNSTFKMKYNKYAIYLSACLYLDKNKNPVVIGLGKLHDDIITLGDELFLEFWNPKSGCCITRLANFTLESKSKTNFNFEFGIKSYEITSSSTEKKKAIMIKTKNRIALIDSVSGDVIIIGIRRRKKNLHFEKIF